MEVSTVQATPSDYDEPLTNVPSSTFVHFPATLGYEVTASVSSPVPGRISQVDHAD
ncbi:hypothetical protein SCP_0600700 [Sparassis crispa]|uniref:Uncharacterized protein n=1 Tax=Sparassis crispa TaxID=139825 RepID=A0A401GPH2_9APHY|nr:hypothetical protein SCP_0600700 [Sparassis crispa]GBE84092.1 hypothetical protein SCP_0600700 [Sparassis crispa]